MHSEEKTPATTSNRRKIVLGVVAMAIIGLITVIAIASIKKIAVGPDKAISTQQFK